MPKAAWPYEEAKRIVDRPMPIGRPVTFETGFGPSGLPTIATFAEVSRTTMVRRAYEDIMGYPRNDSRTRLIVFSDDKDALRRVPENVPNQEMLRHCIGYSLSRIPDPYDRFESFAAHNNAMLCEFLDRFNFDYEFLSSTDAYQTDEFTGGLRMFLHHYDVIRDIIVPTLGDDRAATYSPFMPITSSGQVLQANVVSGDLENDRIGFIHPITGEYQFTSILDGNCKLQWKADWALRWFALEIDYEMAGKDLTDSVTLSSQILRSIGCRPPINMIYELFLDEEGHKISKSKGN